MAITGGSGQLQAPSQKSYPGHDPKHTIRTTHNYGQPLGM